MNYKRIYDNLINRAIGRVVETYTENHHIIPRCMGGSDHPTNIVALTPEEHYLAHQLLVKIYDHSGLVYAAQMMCVSSPDTGTRSNKLFGWLKRRINDMPGPYTGHKHSEETRNKMRESHKSNSSLYSQVSKETHAKLRETLGEEGYSKEQSRRASRPKQNKENYKGPKSEEHKKNMSAAAKNRPRVPCQHCGKEVTKANLKRHEQACV